MGTNGSTGPLQIQPTRRHVLAGMASLAGACSILPLTPQRAYANDVPMAYRAGGPALISREVEYGLAHAVGQYEAMAAAGGWPRIEGPRLTSGQDDKRVATLQQLLLMTGDLARDYRLSSVYTPAVRDAVIRYQARHGLHQTGTVSGLTLAHMNLSTRDRLRQLRVNLARVSELLPKVEAVPRAIIMNAPAFELQAVTGNRVDLVSRVICGTRETPTPVVSATVRAVDVLPYWHVPESVARRALIPQAQKDITYFYQNKIRAYDPAGTEVDPAAVNWYGPDAQRFTFRQDPGPQNALGVVRLDMPNKHIVYMHDTPFKNLFEYPERAISAGCCRVESVLDLADWLLGGQGGWSRTEIERAVADYRRGSVVLERPTPVHFIYLTAWVQDGAIHFRNDLYNRDDSASVAGSSAPPAAYSAASALAP